MNNILQKMTLEQKARLLVGKDFWNTVSYEELNLPSILMCDGPHGVRKENDELGIDGFNQHDSFVSTCFPTASALSQTWNEKLLYNVGKQLGEEAQALGVQILLAPGINHKRIPIGGRNFEYFSEDPYLTGKLASSYVLGLQSKGVGCALKHFVANNSEYNRVSIDTQIDERTFREIYLTAFEMVVKNARPISVMASYNKFRGHHASENVEILKDILIDEWGFDGIIMSDWGAIHDRVKTLNANCHLEMPWQSDKSIFSVIKAVEDGEISISLLDNICEKLIETIIKLHKNAIGGNLNLEKGYEIALEAAKECIVLLKNENDMLPLVDDFCVIGEVAKFPRYQGAGSSKVNPYNVYGALFHLQNKLNKNIEFAVGYKNNLSSSLSDEELIDQAVDIAQKYKTAVIFLGLDDKSESESRDRENLCLPKCELKLVEEIYKVNKNIIIVVQTGAPIEMPFVDKAKAILQAGFNGEAGGEALASILLGEYSPSGKLTETYPIHLEDVYAMKFYATDPNYTEYSEKLLTGYRYFDTMNLAPLFPFGYGLSYTKFEYSNLQVVKAGDMVNAKIDVTNIGKMDGYETLQVYVKKNNSNVFRVNKELKAFDKHKIQKNSTVTFTFILDKRAFSYYDIAKKKFVVESGGYTLYFNTSINDSIAKFELIL